MVLCLIFFVFFVFADKTKKKVMQIMLKNIPSSLSPELLKVLMEMGHGDEIVLADGNFPTYSNTNKAIPLSGVSIPTVLEDILTLLPLDSYADFAVLYMMHGPEIETPEIWSTYTEILEKTDNSHFSACKLGRFAFYERAKKAYAIVATSETAIYANVILKKGIIERKPKRVHRNEEDIC